MLRSLLVAALALPLAAQRNWVVDNSMAAGADFPDLISAYAAAAPNDRIFIRAGNGTPYACPAPFTKPLRILGLGSPKPILMTTIGSNGDIRCAENEVMVFDNLEFWPGNSVGNIIYAYRNHGLILFSRVQFRGHIIARTPWAPGVRVTSRMVLVDSHLLGAQLSVEVAATRLWLLNCETQILSASNSSLDGAIVVKAGSFLRVVGGRHIGGDGLGDCYPPSPGYVGEAAIWAGQGPMPLSHQLAPGVACHTHEACALGESIP
jgi:hypothetical protein